MKTIATIYLSLLGLIALAQPSEEKRFERIKALRAQFITDRLSLTVEEAKAFWPVYEAFKKEEQKIQGRRMLGHRPPDKEGKKLEEMTDAEIEKLMADEFKKQRAIIDVREKYTEEFKKVLPVKKVAMLYKAEHDFNRRLLEELRTRRGKQK